MPNNVTSIEPATGEFLWMGELGDVGAEVAAARAAWPAWAGRSVTYRSEALRRFANVVRGHKDKFADLIARETGKPLWESATEVDAVVGKVDISIAAYRERTPQRKLEGAMGAKVSVRHRPHGVLAVLGPYNFPAHLPNGHIVPALLAGNAVVFKPSEKTPAVGEFLVRMFHEAGVPEGVVRLVVGGPEHGKALAADDGIDGLLFTGSARAGVALSRQFAEMPGKMLALELGGNNPLVVWDTPDPYQAAVIAVQSAFLSAGQRCTAARRLIVKDGHHEGLLDALEKIANRLIVDKPHASPAPFMGPVIDNAAADQLQAAFLDLVMRGGKPIKHLDRLAENKPFLSPAIIDVTEVADRPDAELFGPILQVIRVADFDAAIAEANNTRFGLAASLISGSPQLYDKFWHQARAGVVNWNKPTNGAPSNAPFGGVGMSGNHRPSAYYAADYCAYPVTSSETEQARAAIGVGLADPYAAPRAIADDLARPRAAIDAEPVAGGEAVSEAAEVAPAPAAPPRDDAKAAQKARAAEAAKEARAAEDARVAEAVRAKAAEDDRIAEQARLAESARAEAEARAAEDVRIAEEARVAEAARAEAEVQAAEDARIAEEARAAEAALAEAEAQAAEDARLAEEARVAEAARAEAEARAAEDARIAEEARAAEAARAEAEAQAAEDARIAEETRMAEAARAEAEAKAADDARIAEEARAAEAARAEAEAQAAEDARIAEEARVAEAERAEAEAKAAEDARIAEEARAAEAARAEAEAKAAEDARIAEEARVAEVARAEAEARAAEDARIADEARAAEASRAQAEARAAEDAKIAQQARMAEAARAKAAEDDRIAEQARLAEVARAVAAAKAADDARSAEEARAAEEARTAEAARAAAEAKVSEEAPKPAPPTIRSVPGGPVMPMMDAEAERRADLGSAPADKHAKRPTRKY